MPINDTPSAREDERTHNIMLGVSLFILVGSVILFIACGTKDKWFPPTSTAKVQVCLNTDDTADQRELIAEPDWVYAVRTPTPSPGIYEVKYDQYDTITSIELVSTATNCDTSVANG